MKWFLLLLLSSSSLFFVLPTTSLAITADEYALLVLQKDLPRSLRWFEKMSAASASAATSASIDPSLADPVQLQDLYNSAMPAPQPNRHTGISVKGSIERVLLLLEAAKFFESVQEASGEFQEKVHRVMSVLQIAKDQTDHFKFGEKPEVLFEQWRQAGVSDFPKFAEELEHVLVHIQKLLVLPEMDHASTEMVQTGDVQVEAQFSSEVSTSLPGSSVPSTVSAESSLQGFDVQRFFAYVEASEVGRIAPECEVAKRWATDASPRCQSDDEAGCDRKYARQCKKLQ